ncbi:MAG TPA: hypothetical protein VMD56_01620, partial [Steroidobacteraceae bacterium]|nr:hypothetical protein [Steroidobacteraceae bacterium]
GLRFVLSEITHLKKEAPLQIPRCLVHTLAKMLGFQLGRVERTLPLVLKRRLSMMSSYWDRRE